jgi:hypothetical protein
VLRTVRISLKAPEGCFKHDRTGNSAEGGTHRTLTAGRGCGTLKPGRHIKYEAETPLANFFVAMLNRMGVPVDRMGDSTGKLGYLSDL